MKLAPDEISALQAYWRFYDPRRAEISEEVRRIASTLPEWKTIIQSLRPELVQESDRRSAQLQRDAVVENLWKPYLDDLRIQGIQYAQAGVSYSAWLELIAVFRNAIRRQLVRLAQEDLPAANIAGDGMNLFLDITIETIGEAYLAAKQQLVVRTEERYRAMFERSPLPMWTFDRATLRFIAVNEAAVRHYGYTHEEFAAMTLADIRPPEDVPALHVDVRASTGLVKASPWRHRIRDGTIIDVEIAANDFTLDGKDVRLVLINDVTERERAQQKLRRTEDQLRQAQKMDAIGRLAGGVAHDFNNMLTVIESYACMLEESLEPGDTRRDDASEIRRASERAAGVTRQLLTLSRHSIVAPRSVNVDDVIAKFVPMLRRLVSAQVSVVTHRGAGPSVVVDPGQLEQVLMNLAVNARDAMPDGGRITIETDTVLLSGEDAALRGLPAGEYIVLAVTDTGAGMDAHTQAHIFDPFFTTKAAGKGTGLGLAIVHGIVTQASGSISVYSELAHGTTFRIHLPVSRETVVAHEQVSADAPRTLPSMTVLVVDDEREVRAVAVRVLQQAGCRVLEAATADEARRICVSHEGAIDLAVLDVVLADGRGDLLLHQIRDLRPSIKALFMSGYPAGALSTNGAAPRDLLAKPFSPSSLRGAVARVIGDGNPAVDGMKVSAAQSQRTRVLVADDDDTFRRTTSRILRKAECEVTEADSGRQAIAALETNRFDVVLSDVHMPEGGGLDVLRAIRRVDLDVPVILMTGTPDVSSATIAIEHGAFRYLTKPFDAEALTKTVQHAARAHALARLRREAFSVTGVTAGAVDRAGLEVRFEQAIEQLWLAYQPIFDAKSGALYGVEALVRSNEPSMANPQALLDAATRLSRLPQLGRRVRALAAGAVADRADNLVLFVNLHPEDLADSDLVNESTPLTQIASRVILEVTERASLNSSPELSARLAHLRKLGFRLAVDDIGAGYSGLTSFTELVPEIVKIDMSLVRGVHQSTLKQRTIAALCRLCREIGSLVVGEGVESLDESECLVSLGCDLLQGYLLGRPTRELPPMA